MTLRVFMDSPEAAASSAVATLKRPIGATRARVLSCRRPGRGLAQDELRGIVEECFLDDAFAVPALVRKLLHPRPAPVLPLELENPANHDLVAAREKGADARGFHRARFREHRAFARDEQISPDARHRLILLHRRILRVELRDRIGVRVFFDTRDEWFQGVGGGQGHVIEWDGNWVASAY